MAFTTARPAAPARPGPVVAALALAVALLVVAVVVLAPSALAGLGLVAGLSGAGLVAVALRRAFVATRALEKLSAEMDVLSARLVRLESAPLAARAAAAPAFDVLETNVAEVTAEIGLLGGIVRELAVAVEGHDRDLADLRTEGTHAKERDRSAASVPLAAAATPGASRADSPRLDPIPRIVPPSRSAPTVAPVTTTPPAAIAPPVAAASPAPTPAAIRPVLAAPRASGPSRAPAVDDGAAERREAAIARALDEGRVEVHLQPVVTLPQRRVAFYEALPRLRLDDGLVEPAAFLGALERRGRVPDLDRFLLARAATIARHLAGRGSGAAVALGLAPISAAEPGFLRAVARLVEGHPDLAGRLVVALPQRSWRALDAEGAGALAALAQRGAVLALDRAVDLRLDPQALAERGVTYAKVPAELLLRPRILPSGRGEGDLALADLARSLDRAGIRLIADGVEREEDVPDLLDLDVPFAQGSALAPPRAVRPDVFAPTPAPIPAEPAAPAPPAPEEPAEPAAEPPVRRSFRDFLRRAG